jgi:hypothetical protein
LDGRVRDRLTVREGRKFAFPVGLAFLVLASVAWWRDNVLFWQILGGIGGALLVAGVLIPTHLGLVYRIWMGIARAISKVMTPIFMSIVYYVVMMPIGLVRRTLGTNPIKHEPVKGSYWRRRDPGARRGNLKRQF